MAQTRIVVNPKVELRAFELLEVTGLGNLSDLFAVLISRYGDHLKRTWVVTPSAFACPDFSPTPPSPPTFTYVNNGQQFQQELQIDDPVIQRIAGLIEKF
jgi:hypothetical protein